MEKMEDIQLLQMKISDLEVNKSACKSRVFRKEIQDLLEKSRLLLREEMQEEAFLLLKKSCILLIKKCRLLMKISDPHPMEGACNIVVLSKYSDTVKKMEERDLLLEIPDLLLMAEIKKSAFKIVVFSKYSKKMEKMKIPDLLLMGAFKMFSKYSVTVKKMEERHLLLEETKKMEEMKIPDLLHMDVMDVKMEKLIAMPIDHLGVGSRSSIPTSQNWIALVIVLLASLITATVQLVRFQNIFKGQQSIFEGFVLANAIAFSSSFSSLFLVNKPGLARFCVFCSVASMGSAVTLLLYAATYTQTST